MALPNIFEQQELRNCLVLCKDFINILSKSKELELKHILEWFKELCELLVNLILTILKCVKENKSAITKHYNEHILLYLNQIVSTLSVLIEIFVKENEVNSTLNRARQFAVDKLICCLDGLCSISLNEENSFVKWMDIAIDKVSEIDTDLEKVEVTKKCDEVRQVLEEVLCHAMSVAQIAANEDYKIIKGSSQMVLEVLNSLVLEVNKENMNKAMCNLFVDACNDKLCMLEKRVNAAVLKLCVKIFCEYTKYLDDLYEHCFDSNNGQEEFENLVADFDLHVDRIMQISIFAVACSSDDKNSTKIRNCMANLEFLEGELVPAFKAVKVAATLDNKIFASLLHDHWLDQAKMLQHMIYLIIDPSAFVHVIYEKLKGIFDDVNNHIKTENNLNRHVLKPFIDQAQVLIDFIEISRTEMSKEELKDLMPGYRDIKNVFNEINSASSVLLEAEEDPKKSDVRILKRCKIFLTILKRFCHKLNQSQENDCPSNSVVAQNECKIGNAFFDHILNRGKELLKERSVLYKTPQKKFFTVKLTTVQKSSHSVIGKAKRNVPLSKLVHLQKLSVISKDNDNPSLDLQITDLKRDLCNEFIDESQ